MIVIDEKKDKYISKVTSYFAMIDFENVLKEERSPEDQNQVSNVRTWYHVIERDARL